MTDYLVGADLGQARDPTALAVLERSVGPDLRNRYACRHLERPPLGTPYITGRDEPPEARGVGEQIRALLLRPPLPGCTLVVDETGVGRAVVDSLRLLNMPCRISPVTITGGNAWTLDPDGSFTVPKRELVGTLQVLMGTGRLVFAAGMPLADVLRKELQTFQVKITASGHDTYSAWREGAHDDLVLAVALACWCGEKFPAFTRESIGRGAKRPAPPRGETLGGDARHWPKGV